MYTASIFVDKLFMFVARSLSKLLKRPVCYTDRYMLQGLSCFVGTVLRQSLWVLVRLVFPWRLAQRQVEVIFSLLHTSAIFEHN